MKSNALVSILKFLLPIGAVIVLFMLHPLAGVAAIVALILFLCYKNLPGIYSYFGKVDYSKGDLVNAAAKFEKAYNIGRGRPGIAISYGYILLKLGKVDDAYTILSKLSDSKLPSDDVMNARSNLALAIWKKGDVDGAVNLLEEVMKTYSNTTIYGSLGYLLILKGDLERALAFNLEAYEYNNTNTVILDNLGQTYLLLDETEKAAQIYEKLIEAKPTFPEAYYNYGLVLEALGEPEKALENVQKALDYKLTFLSTITKEDIENKLEELKSSDESESSC